MKLEKSFDREFSGDEDFYYGYKIQVFKILTCPACNSATVLLYSAEGDGEADSQRGDLSAPPIHKYKRQILYAPKKKLHFAIPLPISDIVNHAQAVLVSSPRASFILCRAVLEEICNDFQISSEETNDKGRNYFRKLQDRLLQLSRQENMPEHLQEMIQGIKDLGNEGTHAKHITFAEKVSFQEAIDLLSLIDHVLQSVYVDKARQQEAAETLKRLKEQIL